MPAVAAENVLPLTPAPLHVPPGEAARVTIVSVKHTLGGTLINTMLGNDPTWMLNVRTGPVHVTPPLV